MDDKTKAPETIVVDLTVPPTQEQLAQIGAADPRFHQIMPLAGTVACLAGVAEGDDKKTFAFWLPSAPALFLSLSHRAQRQSERAFPAARFGSSNISFSDAAFAAAFDFFELRAQHFIFAFTAMEAYANECIPDPFTWKTTRTTGGVEEEVTHDREGVERHLPLGEKLDGVLPQVFSTKSIKGTRHWERFRDLRSIRDRLIHLKYFDSNTRPAPGGMPPEKNSVWAELLSTRLEDFSKHMHEIIMHYGGGRRTWARKFPYPDA